MAGEENFDGARASSRTPNRTGTLTEANVNEMIAPNSAAKLASFKGRWVIERALRINTPGGFSTAARRGGTRHGTLCGAVSEPRAIASIRCGLTSSRYPRGSRSRASPPRARRAHPGTRLPFPPPSATPIFPHRRLTRDSSHPATNSPPGSTASSASPWRPRTSARRAPTSRASPRHRTTHARSAE